MSDTPDAGTGKLGDRVQVIGKIVAICRKRHIPELKFSTVNGDGETVVSQIETDDGTKFFVPLSASVSVARGEGKLPSGWRLEDGMAHRNNANGTNTWVEFDGEYLVMRKGLPDDHDIISCHISLIDFLRAAAEKEGA